LTQHLFRVTRYRIGEALTYIEGGQVQHGLLKCRIIWAEDVNDRARVEITQSDGDKYNYVVPTEFLADGHLEVDVGKERLMEDSKIEVTEVPIRLLAIRDGGELTFHTVYVLPGELREALM